MRAARCMSWSAGDGPGWSPMRSVAGTRSGAGVGRPIAHAHAGQISVRGRRWTLPERARALPAAAPSAARPAHAVPGLGMVEPHAGGGGVLPCASCGATRVSRLHFRFVFDARREHVPDDVVGAGRRCGTRSVNEDLRFMHWEGNSPPAITAADVPEMLASRKLFARKFDSPRSPRPTTRWTSPPGSRPARRAAAMVPRPLRVLVTSTLYPPIAIGGYERECAIVVERLREEHEVLVLTGAGGTRRRRPGEAGVRRELTVLPPDQRGALRAPLASIAAARSARRALELPARPHLRLERLSDPAGGAARAGRLGHADGLPRLRALVRRGCFCPTSSCASWRLRGAARRARLAARLPRVQPRGARAALDPLRRFQAAISWNSEAIRAWSASR